MNAKNKIISNVLINKNAMNIYGVDIETKWLNLFNLKKKYESDFLSNGYVIFDINPKVADELMGFFSKDLESKFNSSDSASDYIKSDLPSKVIERLNQDNIFYSPPLTDSSSCKKLSEFLNSISESIEEQLASGWKVVNVRAWVTKPSANFGPSDWHADGSSHYLRKIMIYPKPPNIKNGSIEIFDRSGNSMVIENNAPSAILFDSSVLLHRGIPGTDLRPAIEVTISPSEQTDTNLVFAGQNARSPCLFPSNIYDIAMNQTYYMRPNIAFYKKATQKLKFLIKAFLNSRHKIRHLKIHRNKNHPGTTNLMSFLNIGGGPMFNCAGWVNLEAVASPSNPAPFMFTPECTFPIPSSSISLIYSSHCFEHLNDSTIKQILDEAYRVINRKGVLLIKIPDYDMLLNAWKNHDALFFSKWGIDPLIPFWRNSGVEDTLQNRAAMIFCGYWNKQYGDHFSNKVLQKSDAYHGPAIMPEGEIEEIMSKSSAHEIAKSFSDFVSNNVQNPIFNHQNAWNRQELQKLLLAHGFSVQSFDEEKIIQDYSHIPTILNHSDVSLYCTAIPIL